MIISFKGDGLFRETLNINANNRKIVLRLYSLDYIVCPEFFIFPWPFANFRGNYMDAWNLKNLFFKFNSLQKFKQIELF